MVTSPAKGPSSNALLNFGFLELDVLARDRVVLLEDHLLGLVARILLGHIEKAGVSRTDELDLDGCRLGHREFPMLRTIKAARARRRLIGALIGRSTCFCQPSRQCN